MSVGGMFERRWCSVELACGKLVTRSDRDFSTRLPVAVCEAS